MKQVDCISDYSNITVCYENTPDCLYAVELLKLWTTQTNCTFIQASKSKTDGSDLQVFLNCLPIIDKPIKQIIVATTDPLIWNEIVNSIKEPRDLDKYGTNTMLFTPYSITEFIHNRLEPSLKQDIKGIVHLPYLEELCVADDISPQSLDVMTLENMEFNEDISVIDEDIMWLYYEQYDAIKNTETNLLVSPYIIKLAIKDKVSLTARTKVKGVVYNAIIKEGELILE